MIHRLHNIAIEERRQLVTLGFAIVVFTMTLWALQFRDQGSTPNQVVAVEIAKNQATR
jgi:hypothetical protein